MKSQVNGTRNQKLHFPRSPILLLACVAWTAMAHAQALRIVVFDEGRSGIANLHDGSLADDLRATLATRFAKHELVATDVLEDSILTNVDLLILHNAFNTLRPITPLSEAEQLALSAFIEGGGAALIAADGHAPFRSVANTLTAPFEIIVGGSSDDCDEHFVQDADAHAVTSGPFGKVTLLRTCQAGWFSKLGPYASPLAVGRASPVLAVIERDAIRTGSGRMVLASDANWLGDSADRLLFGEHSVLFSNALAWLTEKPPTPFLRGDCNDDTSVDLSDASCILNWLFAGRVAPGCRSATDTNRDAAIEITDALWLLNFLFRGGPPPDAPFPQCGRDASAECENSSCNTP